MLTGKERVAAVMNHEVPDRVPLDIGYVFAQVHNIQPGVPIDNILAMYEAYREMAAY